MDDATGRPRRLDDATGRPCRPDDATGRPRRLDDDGGRPRRLDDEGRPRWLDDDEQRAWRALAGLVQALPAALDRQLQTEAGIPHTYYLILAMLSEAPERTLRMTELAGLTSGSQSRLSHAVSRLEERGWVVRRQCPTDRRGQLASLTDCGFEVLRGLAPGHVEEVRRLVFDGLTREQVALLHEITATINARISRS